MKLEEAALATYGFQAVVQIVDGKLCVISQLDGTRWEIQEVARVANFNPRPPNNGAPGTTATGGSR